MAAHFAKYVATVTATNTLYSGEVEPPDPGTGFLLTFNGYVVTDRHVVESPLNFKDQKVKVTLAANPNLSFDAEYVEADPDVDIVLLRLKPPQPYRSFLSATEVFPQAKKETVHIGRGIAVIGFPVQSPDTITEYPGCLAGKYDPYWFSSATQNPGSSGSPVLTGAERSLSWQRDNCST